MRRGRNKYTVWELAKKLVWHNLYQLLSEGTDDSNVGVELSVDDGHQLGGHLGRDGDGALDRVLALVRSLDGVDDGHDLLPVGQETGAGREDGLDIQDLDGASVFEVVTLGEDLGVLAEVLGDALESLHDVVLVDGVQTLVAGNAGLDEDLSRLLLALLDLQLLRDLLQEQK